MPTNGYPQFPKGKFNHFNRDLSVVDYYIRAAEALAGYENATRQHDASIAEYSTSNSAMYEILATKLTALTTVGPATPTDTNAKFAAVENALHRMRHATKQTCDEIAAKREIREVLMTILPLFCTFDKAGLDAVVEPLLAGGKELSAKKSKMSGAKGAAKGKYNEAIKTFDHIYASPDRLDHLPFASRPEAAFQEAKEFIEAWQYRARLFMLPTTIEGTAIRSLPPDTKKVWSNAYNKLKFSELKHQDFYTPFTYKGSEFVTA